jgi:predicted MFS family arabinose efflux permease
LPVSIYQLGLALSTLPAAWIMNRMGRRAAYVLGAVLGVISGVVAAQGIAHSDFVTFCIGTALAGFYAACVQSYRFAATDMVSEPAQQAKAISRVMIGGLIAAIIGPQVVIWTRDALPATRLPAASTARRRWPCWPCPCSWACVCRRLRAKGRG